MRSRTATPFILSMWILASSAMGLPQSDNCAGPVDPVPGFLVLGATPKFPASAAIAALESSASGIDLTLIDSIPGRPIHLLAVTWPASWDDTVVEAWLDGVNAGSIPSVAWMEQEYAGRVPEGGTGSIFVDSIDPPPTTTTQYAWQLAGVAAAQQRTRGQGVVVAVVDTGVNASHPLLLGRTAPGGFDFVTHTPDTTDRADGADSDADGVPDELVGHGTFVASIIATVAPDARILPIRVLDGDGGGWLWTLARGVFHAIDRGVEVINISIVSTYNSEAVALAVEEAVSHGIVVVASAGNCADETRLYPAARSDAIAVGATNHLDQRAPFSSFGDWIDLSAPGVTTLSGGTAPPERAILGAHGIEALAMASGTSFSAPWVAATAALVRAQHPEWPPTLATAESVRSLLESLSEDIAPENPGWNGLIGAGRIHALAATLAGPIAPQLGDLNADGAIGAADLAILLGEWSAVHSSADLDGDGSVRAGDLAIILGNWTS